MEANSQNEQPCMPSKPEKEHQWLRKFAGRWTAEMEADMGPGQPPCKSKGSESVRFLGDLWMIADGEGEMPDGTKGHMVLTIGYDTAKKKFVGSWFGSMMSNMWVYEGELDASGKVLTLNTEGPSMTNPGKLSKYRDVHTMITNDERELRSWLQHDDGEWRPFMRAIYKRAK